MYGIVCVVPEKFEKLFKINNIDKLQIPREPNDVAALVNSDEVRSAVSTAQVNYLPWKEFRNKDWVPEKKEHVWTLVKIQRQASNMPTPIRDKDGSFYQFNSNSQAEFLYELTLNFAGTTLGAVNFSESEKRQIIRRNLIEESIASSKLEGANTSREAARRMLNEGRKPRDHGEQMIANNHAAMKRIEEEAKFQPLSLDLLFDLHRQVTSGTLVNPEHAGALRQTFDEKGNPLKIMLWDGFTVAYVAPDREFVEQELPKLIKFANDEDDGSFIHPLFKAIMLHFWIGLLHPFEDGNGRLARILFYWYMLRKGYWAFSYLSLSEKILNSPMQYAMAYIYSEQDNYDLNYFIHYNISKLKLARDDLQKYLKKKIEENRKSTQLIQDGHNFNPRQLTLLQYLAKDEQRNTTMTAYHNINAHIAYVSAVTDLKKLVKSGLLTKRKVGRNVYYFPTEKVRALFK